ncbi:MAG: hypothetical protein ACI4J5_00135 [Oscillospiraceae bacterium]
MNSDNEAYIDFESLAPDSENDNVINAGDDFYICEVKKTVAEGKIISVMDSE